MLGDLTTESRNPESESLDRLSALEIVELINREDAAIAAAVHSESRAIAQTIDVAVDRLTSGGRLVYFGAGTSGRLGVLDAVECVPTFNIEPGQVTGIIAGGAKALTQSIEGAEDHPEYGAADLKQIGLGPLDVAVGIATSGRTPYVIGGLAYARSVGAFAVGLSCNQNALLNEAANLTITPVVGPEIISGSTRMKSGTATKMVLNMLSTGTMVRLGKTFGNLMVDLRATNKKLENRANRIVCAATSLSEIEAAALLEQCRGEVKTAILVSRGQCSPDLARQRLNESGGHLRKAIDHQNSLQPNSVEREHGDA